MTGEVLHTGDGELLSKGLLSKGLSQVFMSGFLKRCGGFIEWSSYLRGVGVHLKNVSKGDRPKYMY